MDIELELPNGVKVIHKTWVVKELSAAMIIGSSFMAKYGGVLDFNRKELRLMPGPDMVRVPFELDCENEYWRAATTIQTLYSHRLEPQQIVTVAASIPK